MWTCRRLWRNVPIQTSAHVTRLRGSPPLVIKGEKAGVTQWQRPHLTSRWGHAGVPDTGSGTPLHGIACALPSDPELKAILALDLVRGFSCTGGSLILVAAHGTPVQGKDIPCTGAGDWRKPFASSLSLGHATKHAHCCTGSGIPPLLVRWIQLSCLLAVDWVAGGQGGEICVALCDMRTVTVCVGMRVIGAGIPLPGRGVSCSVTAQMM